MALSEALHAMQQAQQWQQQVTRRHYEMTRALAYAQHLAADRGSVPLCPLDAVLTADAQARVQVLEQIACSTGTCVIEAQRATALTRTRYAHLHRALQQQRLLTL